MLGRFSFGAQQSKCVPLCLVHLQKEAQLLWSYQHFVVSDLPGEVRCTV